MSRKRTIAEEWDDFLFSVRLWWRNFKDEIQFLVERIIASLNR